MLEFKRLPNKQRALKLDISPAEFLEIWRKTFDSKDSDLTALFTSISPHLDYWDAMLRGEVSREDVGFVSMLRLLSVNVNESLDMVEEWLLSLEDLGISSREELDYLALERIRNLRFFPENAREYTAEWSFAQYLKYGTAANIKKGNTTHKNYKYESLDESELLYYEDDSDFMSLRHLGLDDWGKYLLYLLRQGHTTSSISRLTHVPRMTLHPKEKDLWQLLKRKLSQN